MKQGYQKVLLICLLLLVAEVSLCQRTYRVDSLRNALPKASQGRERIDILNQLGFEFIHISLEDAEIYSNEALLSARQINYTVGTAAAFKNLGLINVFKSEYALAMEYCYKALKIYEALDDKAGQARILNNLSIVMMEQKEYGRAYDFTLQSLAIKRSLGDSAGVANSLMGLAEYYARVGDFERALSIADEVEARYQQQGNAVGMSFLYQCLGDIYASQQNVRKASYYYTLTVNEAQRINNAIVVTNAKTQLGLLYLSAQVLDSAYTTFQQALRLARVKKYKNSELQIVQGLANYFQRIHHLDSALYYTNLMASLERDIAKKQMKEQVSMMQMLYTFEKQDQEIAFQKTIVRRQYVAIIGVSLILILSVFFGFRVSALNKANREAKEALIVLNKEKNRINENLESIVKERTEELMRQNQKILDYAFFTAHEVRGPLARILGLIELSKIPELSEDDKKQIMKRLEDASTELDDIIRNINRRLESAKQ